MLPMSIDKPIAATTSTATAIRKPRVVMSMTPQDPKTVTLHGALSHGWAGHTWPASPARSSRRRLLRSMRPSALMTPQDPKTVTLHGALSHRHTSASPARSSRRRLLRSMRPSAPLRLLTSQHVLVSGSRRLRGFRSAPCSQTSSLRGPQLHIRPSQGASAASAPSSWSARAITNVHAWSLRPSPDPPAGMCGPTPRARRYTQSRR